MSLVPAPRGPDDPASLLEAVLSSARDGIMAFRSVRRGGSVVDFTWTLVSPAGERMIGKSAAELIGRSLLATVPSVREEGLFERCVEVVRGGEPLDTEHPHTIGGARTWYHIRAVRHDDGFVLILSDISHRKAVEGQLAMSEKRFRQIFAAAGIGMAVTDPRGVIVEANPSILRMLGYAEEEMIGKKAERFIHPDDVTIGRSLYRELGEGKRDRFQVERRFLRADGKVLWARQTVSLLKGDGDLEGSALGMLEDIGQHVWAREQLLEYQERLREAKDAAEEASRNKSEFLAKMSHELRTPLNSVIGFANVLLRNRSGNLTPDDLTFLERIASSGKHLLVLINDVLDLSKVEAGRMHVSLRTVDLAELVRETVAELQGQAEGRPIVLESAVPSDLAEIQTDRPKLKQILINLLGNALKFTEEGRVRVVVHSDPKDRLPTRIDIEDTGPGIPEEHRERIFEHFHQVDNSPSRRFKGTGLGLAIARSFADLLGYRITLDTEVGVGTTFHLHLSPEGAPGETTGGPRSDPQEKTL